jgi:hypothetical protein
MKMRYKQIGWLVAFTALVFTPAGAQNLNKEVYVVRSYEPTLSDANKYNFLPSTSAVETQVPAFQYSITPKPLPNSFVPNPIKAAKTVTTSVPKIYNSWLKLGLGNYSTALAEFNISNRQSKDYAYGAYFRHKSSHARIMLANNEKVNSRFVENNIVLYGKRFFPQVTLSGNLKFDQKAFSYYGYNTNNFLASPDIDKDSLKQKVYKPGFEMGLKSNSTDARDLKYSITGSMDYFTDKLKNKEPRIMLGASFSKEVSGFLGGLDLLIDYSQIKSEMDTTGNTIVAFNPWISKSSDDWSFRVGFQAVADAADITKYYFYPQAHLDIIIVKDVLIPFVGITGKLQKNSYQQLFEENMFIKPGLTLKNTSSNFEIYGGLKGNISSVIRFRGDVTLTVYKDQHFYVNDTVSADPLFPLHSQFTAEYDDVNLLTYHAQLVVNPNNNFSFSLDGKYFDYKMFKQVKPWHRPDFTVSMDGSYTINKVTLGAGLNIIGNRWVKDYSLPDEMRKIKPALDANFTFDYRYSKLLTIFAGLHNITDNSYLLWNQYPVQRFNFMFGFSYKL